MLSEELGRAAGPAARLAANGHSLRCRWVRRSTLDEEDVDELATVFGVSSWVIEHQIA